MRIFYEQKLAVGSRQASRQEIYFLGEWIYVGDKTIVGWARGISEIPRVIGC